MQHKKESKGNEKIFIKIKIEASGMAELQVEL